MKKILILLSITMLIGCAAPQARWYKNGVSRADTRNYYAECVYNVGMNKITPENENKLINACMVKNGFRWGVPN